MKRKGFIFDKVCSLENIKQAIHFASLGKKNRKIVQMVLQNENKCAHEVQKILLSNYIPSPYTKKVIIDRSSNKIREIFIPKFYPDQIIQWALMLQLEKVFLKGMYHFNCASIKGRGGDRAIKYLDKILANDHKNTKYCLKIDIKKFYPSIDKTILKQKFRGVIKDNKVLELLDRIVDTVESGVPIGNYTSQWFANFYLQDFDHFVKEKLKIPYYVRYMDDMVFFLNNKKQLHKFRLMIENYLFELKLKMKENWALFKTNSRPIDFLGYKFYRGYKTLRARLFLRITRRFRSIKKCYTKNNVFTAKNASAVISYWGRIKVANSQNFYAQFVSPYVNIKQCKSIISHFNKSVNFTVA